MSPVFWIITGEADKYFCKMKRFLPLSLSLSLSLSYGMVAGEFTFGISQLRLGED
jgi:hypothetical protein